MSIESGGYIPPEAERGLEKEKVERLQKAFQELQAFVETVDHLTLLISIVEI
jgi:hypothetical protein